MNLKSLFTILWCLPALVIYADEKSPAKFGKINPADFEPKAYTIDSNAHAVILADIGTTEVIGSTKGWFSLEFKRYKRVRILSKNGYDAANDQVYIYKSGNTEEDLQSLKAVTYNLENGKVVETKLDTKSAVFTDHIDKRRSIKKFTLPNIKEGCIIEIQYTIVSDFLFNLQPWSFQGEYPCLWSEYNVSIPEFFYYLPLSQGFQDFHIRTNEDRNTTFTITDNGGAGASERMSLKANITDYRYVMKNIGAMKTESYTSTINNHLSRIEFQLKEYRYPLTPRSIMGNWKQTTKSLLEDEDFGIALNKDNGWLNDIMVEATKNATSDLSKAQSIYNYVRDHMTCSNHNRIWLEKPLKNMVKVRNGNEAEINLLLTAMLRKAGLTADPVMLSTRSHGYTYPLYPILNRYNYVISKLNLGNKEYLLDASEPRLGFGKLTYECYNGAAIVINEDATPIELLSDSLKESSMSFVAISSDEKGNLSGNMKYNAGYSESYRLRNQVKEKGQEQVFSEIKKSFVSDVELSETVIDSIDKYDLPLTINYNFKFNNDKEDILYINPMFSEAWKENPFKSGERSYPIEMPYAMDESYFLRFEIPAGYVVDELPKQVKMKLNEEGDGAFEYLLVQSEGFISLRSRIQLKRAYFSPEEHDILREFFNLIVKKHSEQIVFKKKS
ncbi:MAG: DUF3857 domain-containing protein [Bacteroidota bacterium]